MYGEKTRNNQYQRVKTWLAECLRPIPVKLKSAHNLRYQLEREVWDCFVEIEDRVVAVILKIFKPGSPEAVNTNLPPHQAVQKCLFAMRELPDLGIPTPRVYGDATINRSSGLVSERIERIDWTPNARVEAARILARLHTLQGCCLSVNLQDLAKLSNPREYRTTGGYAPHPKVRTLVHGDYFSANILPTTDGLRIIDWETFGWGDPMWDLGFLIGADRGLPEIEVEAVIAAYEAYAPVDRAQLRWHQHRWAKFWKKHVKTND